MKRFDSTFIVRTCGYCSLLESRMLCMSGCFPIDIIRMSSSKSIFFKKVRSQTASLFTIRQDGGLTPKGKPLADTYSPSNSAQILLCFVLKGKVCTKKSKNRFMADVV